jgi:hypothetical protein
MGYFQWKSPAGVGRVVQRGLVADGYQVVPLFQLPRPPACHPSARGYAHVLDKHLDAVQLDAHPDAHRKLCCAGGSVNAAALAHLWGHTKPKPQEPVCSAHASWP